jgi:hypothetical protein
VVETLGFYNFLFATAWPQEAAGVVVRDVLSMVFEAFRKRQKEMLAVLVLIAMFVFIAGDLPSRFIYGDRSGGNPRIGEIWGKPRTATDIQKLEVERNAGRNVLMRMAKAAGDKADFRRLSKVFTDDIWQQLHQGGYDWRLAYFALEGKADRIGIKVTDDDVTQFLRQATGGTLNREAFKEALAPPRRSGQSSRERGEAVSEHDFYRIMARELKVRRALEALSETVDYRAPLDFWRGRLEDARTLFTLEMVRVPVDKFVETKTEPTNTDLQAIYSRYKSITPDPENNVVGFQRPATAEFEYASIPTEKWLDQVQVTDEECKKYYDANQSEFRDELPIEQPPPPKAAEKPAAKDAGKGTAPKAPAMEPSKKGEKKTEPLKKADPPKKLDAPKLDAKMIPADKKTSAIPSLEVLRTVAATSVYLQAQDSKKADDKKPAGKEAAPAKADAKAAAKPDDKKAEPPKIDAKQPDATKKVAPPVPQPNNAGQAKAGEAVPQPKVKPYSLVKPEIERKLKMQKARVLIRERLKKAIDEKFAPYADVYILARRKYEDANNGNLEGFKPPEEKKPSIAELAKEFRGDYHKLGPTTEADVRKMPGFGKIYQAVANIYDQQKLAYAAQLEADFDENNFYVYWRTNYKPPEAMDFATVRDQCIAIWRREQAQKPAQKFAEELAEKVKKSGFAEAVKGTDYKPFQPGAFRRATYIPGVGNAMQLSQMQRFPTPQLQGVPDAKATFLDQAVEMEEGEVKVIPGAERENFYVVKCVKREPPSFEEFASEYEQFLRQVTQYQDLVVEQYFPRTAVRVLEESGYSPPTDAAKGKGKTGDEPVDTQ